MSSRLGDSIQCGKCEKEVNSRTMAMEEQSMMKELSLVDGVNLCYLLQKFADVNNVHPTHNIMIRLYMRL